MNFAFPSEVVSTAWLGLLAILPGNLQTSQLNRKSSSPSRKGTRYPALTSGFSSSNGVSSIGGERHASANFSDESDGMDTPVRTAAEKHGVKPCIRIIGSNLCPSRVTLRCPSGMQRGIDLAGARDEPMEFEGKKCAVSGTASLRPGLLMTDNIS